MIYSSVEFLLLFPVFFLAYWAIPNDRSRLVLLLLGSLGFYAWSRYDLVLLLLSIAVFGWLGGHVLAWRPSRVVLALFVAVLVGTLALFKFGHLAIGQLPFPVPGRLEVWIAIMPLGISFFVFEAISYLADVRARRLPHEPSALRFSLFISFFPHLIAGPIMRGSDLLPQFSERKRLVLARALSGIQLFVIGFVKKVLIADPCGDVAETIFHDPAPWGSGSLWIGALAYTAQIFGDFSGYTDMGRGVARMLGYELPVNFLRPYLAVSPRDFWRRWHISLSSWLRDYLYKPLGGSWRGDLRTYVNLMTTMFLGGLWHGSNWTFAVWGLYHGALLAAERMLTAGGRTWGVPRPLAVVATLLLVIVGWVIFRSPSLADAANMLSGMFVPRGGQELQADSVITSIAGVGVTLGWMAVVELFPGLAALMTRFGKWQGVVWGIGAAAVFWSVPVSARAFIYFRF